MFTITQKDLAYAPATTLMELFKLRVITPVDVLEAQKTEVEKTNGKVNAIVNAYWDRATQMAEESTKRYANGTYRYLEGITVGVKDEHYDEGWVMTMGSMLFKDDPPKEKADPIVAKLKDAGAIPSLQVTVPEFTFNQITDTILCGTTRNPWNLEYTCGASSGGSGAALAAGYCTLATGSDMGGSIRIPSALAGGYGLKPAFGYIHTEEIFSYFSGSGPMARSFEDMVLMYNAISGPAPESVNVAEEPEYPVRYPSIKGMKLAYLGGAGIVKPAQYVADSVNDALDLLRAQGANVDVVDFDFELDVPIFDIISKMAIGGAMGGMFKSFADKTDQMTYYVRHFVEKALSAGYGPDDLFEMQAEVKRLWNKLADEVYAHGYDLVLAPTLAMTHVPAQHDFTRGVPLTEDGVTYPLGVLMQCTLPWNLLNWCPVVSVPTGIGPKGVPIGMQIIGKPKDTATVFRVAYAYSKGATRMFTGDLFPGEFDS
jgi:amidase